MTVQVLCHRGYWKNAEEKNSLVAFRRGFELGLGTETDIRDASGRLVISHDCPSGDEMPLNAFLDLAQRNMRANSRRTIALNVKADGLATEVAKTIRGLPWLDCFVFDMSVPDMRAYFDAGIPVLTRMSEVEREPAWLERSAGVWLDAFEGEWYGDTLLTTLLDAGKRVCVVSPELHRRRHDGLWERLRPLRHHPRLSICTDHPEEALRFFELDPHEGAA